MAGQAEKRGLPPELPLMASLVESGMKNLNFGDADRVGFFQMRVSIWDSGPYKGYADKPELQVKWFLDEAEKVKNARVAAGKPIDDPNHYGEWIADTERPAEQYRGRYQTKLEEAQGLLKSRPAAGAAVPQPVVSAAPAVEAAAAVNGGGGTSPLGSAALTIAKTQLGVAEIGGANRGKQVEEYLAAAKVAPGNPWCASFVTWALGKAGHEMPGGGWAAVQTWVRPPSRARTACRSSAPTRRARATSSSTTGAARRTSRGDGHIGFLDSTVQNGKFTALEGNNADKVNSVPRQMGGANIKFLRIEGQGTAAAAAPAAPAAPVAPAVQYVQPNTPYAQPPSRCSGRRGAGADTPYAQPGAAQPVAAAVEAAPAAPRKPIDPTQFGGEGTRRRARSRGARAAREQEHRARRRRDQGHQGRPHRPARRRGDDQALPGAQDHGHVHVLRPRQVHRGRLGLQPPLRPRHGHRRDRRRDRRARARRWRGRSRASSRR